MGKIISIHSYRGGTGKSNITANLAATVAMQRQRVAIIDTDIQSPGIHILFGMDEDDLSPCLNDFLYGKCSIKEAAHDVTSRLVDSEGTDISGGGKLYLLPSSIKAGDIARILREGYKAHLLNDGLIELIEVLNLDYLFIDTHPGLNDETLLSIAISDDLLLIMRPDRQDYQGTAVTVEVARKLDVENMLMVINKALPEMDFDGLKHSVEEIYKAEVIAVLPSSDDLIRAGSAGLFSLKNPQHPFSQGITAIAARLIRQ
ncbi:MAG: MinD/ParA family protein [Chloroflexi bacterium]|uniref:MinD/ParA family protein n=1 Tax=Candidatus Chlorohelix allophototropha TaxID=3003348 RepID=A0A8T7M038_9CHLR|nr:MinD/ParA family protein [Chloroflexota bacterium]WJW67852.1 MinD/ParA family protein [Chloroflexota bacterium L227-S17]